MFYIYTNAREMIIFKNDDLDATYSFKKFCDDTNRNLNDYTLLKYESAEKLIAHISCGVVISYPGEKLTPIKKIVS